jgi:hypothetical protein
MIIRLTSSEDNTPILVNVAFIISVHKEDPKNLEYTTVVLRDESEYDVTESINTIEAMINRMR